MDRRTFFGAAGAGLGAWLLPSVAAGAGRRIQGNGQWSALMDSWREPAREFSQAPFWFWNDNLTDEEILRQMDDFAAHGVYGFVIHPRAGLPRSIGWMSDNMLRFMRTAVEGAAKRDMWVVLYDEGMYPSGSSSGQVVAENPAFRTRAFFCIDLDAAEPGTVQAGVRIGDDRVPVLGEGQNLVAIVKRQTDGHRLAIVDRAMAEGRSYIRGLHFLQDDPPRRNDHREVPENTPPAADILNPQAVQCFIRLVYQRFYDAFREHFGKTIKAVFTDEPSILARGAERGAVPATTGIIEHVNTFLGYDFTPHLPALWHADEPDAARYREDYNRAIEARLEETLYAQLSNWCREHGVALTGHPAAPDAIGQLRHFQIPGQDIVWRYIEPGKASALEGAQSTQAKCASSAMVHLGRRRNSNEFCGAYGHNFTFDEMQWLTYWLIVRGCNMLYPHAFYYSIRGPRIDERPPDVGPNSPWWDQYKPYADACSRLCQLNTDARHVCSIAILGRNDYLPWRAAKVCFEHQRDFNYLEARHLWEDAKVSSDGIELAGMRYKALIVEDEPPVQAKQAMDRLEAGGRVIRWDGRMDEQALLRRIDELVEPDARIEPATRDIRVRHVVKDGLDCYLLFNEGESPLDAAVTVSARGAWSMLDARTGGRTTLGDEHRLQFDPHEMKVIAVAGRASQ